MANAIPKIFHQIWLGGEMPDEHKYLRDHMLELHPNWKYMFWNENNLPKLKNSEYLQNDMMLKFKSDIIRYEIVEMFGGVYVDTDFLFFKNIEPCLQRDHFICRTFDDDTQRCFMNGLFGFPANHFVLSYMNMLVPAHLKILSKVIGPQKKHQEYLNLIGPGLLYKALKDLMPHAYTWPKKYFVPFTSETMLEDQNKDYPDAYTIHLWNYRHGPSNISVHKNLSCYKKNNPTESQ